MNKTNLNLEEFELDDIVSIELIGERETIDITVEDTHMFFANDIYTHNSGYNKDTIGLDSTQGSIKRVQACHLVISVTKNDEQEVLGLANMKICKARSGGSGQVFENMTFNNKTMQFNTDPSPIVNSFEFGANSEKKQKEDNTRKAAEALQKLKIERELRNNAALVN